MSPEGSFSNGKKVLINGPLQLTTSDVLKIGALLVAIVTGWVTLSNRVDNINARFTHISNTVVQRLGALDVILAQRQIYIERLITLEREVAQVNERATNAVTSEARLINERLGGIERRLGGIENRLARQNPLEEGRQ